MIIDPLSAYLGKVDSYKDSDVRPVLARLAALAEKLNVAVVGVMHLSKGAQRPALYRTLGSIAFVAAARISLLVAPHPHDESKRVLAPFKENTCAPSATLAYQLDRGAVRWDPDPVPNVTRDSLLAVPDTDRAEIRQADHWLQDQFAVAADGVLKVKEIMAAAQAEGIAQRTLYRATQRLLVTPTARLIVTVPLGSSGGRPGLRGGSGIGGHDTPARDSRAGRPRTTSIAG